MSKKVEFKNDEEFIKEYKELGSALKVSELYGCSKTTVLNHCKKIGFDPNSIKQYKLSEQDKQEIILAYNNATSTELAEKYNVSRGMITKIWYDNNLKNKKVVKLPKNDLTGLKFGKLTVLYPTDERNASGCIKWMCQCECGKQKTIAGTDLKSGKIKSCGCLSKECLSLGRKANDLTGKVFGKLTAIKRIEDKVFSSDRIATQWLCECECGNEIKVLTSNLTTGNTQSCGLCGNNSHGNIKIAKILDENNISYEREKRFNSCKDKTQLPFDFYINNQYLIEYDGKQHYRDNLLYSSEDIKKHDEIKNKWCKENNIPLIRIPYTQYDNLTLEDLLLETSKFIVK